MKRKCFLALFAPRASLGETHLARHSEATDFMCDDCGEQGKREDKLGEHEKRMHIVLSKASVTRDKEGEVFGSETADLEKGGKKLERAVEGSYKRNKTHVETNPAKASEELFETEVSDVERGPNPRGGRLQEFEQ